MSASDGEKSQLASLDAEAPSHGGVTTSEEALRDLRRQHLARGRSAIDRARALCRFAGIGEQDARPVPTDPASKAATAVRLSAQALARVAEAPLDPAADARCARNAAAAAAVVATAAQAHAGAGELPDAAHAAAVRASLASGQAAGQVGLGRDEALNRAADEAEAAAVAAAKAAGWWV
ncbi:hypothetical protein [Streptomyces noursei]|uniref:hypothetical protein n=1 Tax=Streptomyces noursei TaxID=1971 RepID=UPI0019643F9F|nr:hypothetical protein [Streptomyces noursei]QRX93461.1 hypothetical protein JNO44_23715 [Streptomyces noursei]